MTLEESVDGLEKLESNGITAYIESGLYETISQRGNIYVEFVTDKFGGKGFSIAVKRTPQEKTDCC
ncbi:MAG: hypothetical protein WBP29_06015 [Candidatus Zixiibacteriota bacterium]